MVIVSHVDVLELWSIVGGCRCLGNHVSLQVRATCEVKWMVTGHGGSPTVCTLRRGGIK